MKLKVIRFLDFAVEYAIYGAIFSIPISIAMISIFTGMASGLFLFRIVISWDFSVIKSHRITLLFLMLFFLFMGLSLFNSGPLFTKGVKAILFKWGKYAMFLLAILGIFKDTKHVIRAVGVLLFSATLVGLTVFTQKFLGFEFLRGRALAASYLPNFPVPVSGPFKSQNGLMAYLSCVTPVILSLSLWRWKNALARVALFLVTTMLIAASFWTFCRGGWVGLISGLICVLLLTNGRSIRKWFVLIFLSTFLLSVPIISGIFYYIRPGEDSNRFLLAKGALQMIADHPFLGKGVGTFMDYCARYTNDFGAFYAHNCFLQIWAESGVFSLLFFLLLVGYVFFRSIKLILEIPKSLNFFILTGLTSGLLGFLVHSFFDVHLYSLQLSFLFWVILSLTVAFSFKLDSLRTPQV